MTTKRCLASRAVRSRCWVLVRLLATSGQSVPADAAAQSLLRVLPLPAAEPAGFERARAASPTGKSAAEKRAPPVDGPDRFSDDRRPAAISYLACPRNREVDGLEYAPTWPVGRIFALLTQADCQR